MENQNIDQPSVQQEAVPNSTAVLVLGIVSIVTCWCYGVVGMTCAIIALVLANKARTAYLADPNQYTRSSYDNVKGGKVCAIIGIVLSSLYLLYFVVVMAIYGSILMGAFPWEQLNNY